MLETTANLVCARNAYYSHLQYRYAQCLMVNWYHKTANHSYTRVPLEDLCKVSPNSLNLNRMHATLTEVKLIGEPAILGTITI